MAATTITLDQKYTFVSKLSAEIYSPQVKAVEDILISSGLDYYRIFVSENDEKLLAKLDHNNGLASSIYLSMTLWDKAKGFNRQYEALLGKTRPKPINFHIENGEISIELNSTGFKLKKPYGYSVDENQYNKEAYEKYINRYGETMEKLRDLKVEERDFEERLHDILKNVRSLNSLKKIDSDLYDHWVRIIGDPTSSKALSLIPDSIKDTIHKHNEAKKEEAEKIAEVESKSTNKEVAA